MKGQEFLLEKWIIRKMLQLYVDGLILKLVNYSVSCGYSWFYSVAHCGSNQTGLRLRFSYTYKWGYLKMGGKSCIIMFRVDEWFQRRIHLGSLKKSEFESNEMTNSFEVDSYA